MRKRIDIGCDVLDLVLIEHLVTPEGGHLTRAALLVATVDPHPQRLLDTCRTAAPEPVIISEVGEILAPFAVASVTGCTIVAEALAPRASHNPHEGFIGKNRVITLGLYAAHPDGPLALSRGETRRGRCLLVDAEKTSGVGRPERPSGNEKPQDDRPDVGHDKEHE